MKRVLARTGGASLALLCGVWLNGSPAGAEPLSGGPYHYSLGDLQPLSVIVLAPTGSIVDSTAPQIATALNGVLAEHTNLSVRLVDEERTSTRHTLAECEGRLRCFVEYVRTDYDPTHPAILMPGDDWEPDSKRSRFRPWTDVEKHLAALRQSPGKLLFILSAVRQGGRGRSVEQLRVELVDTDEALRVSHEARMLNRTDEDAIEAMIAERAILLTPALGEITSEAQLKSYLRKVVDEDCRGVFEAEGLWEPFGELTLLVDRADLEIEVDGKKVGATKAGETRIGRVRSGVRVVRLSGPGFLPTEAEVRVERGQQARVELAVMREPNEVARVSRQTLFWGGLGLAAAGAAMTVYAIHKASSSNVGVYNIYQGAQPQGSSEFYKLGTDQDPSRPDVDPTAGKKIPLAPLGYSLGAAGLTWALSTTFMNDDETIPWLEGGLGLAAFVLSFGASLLLDGNAVPSP